MIGVLFSFINDQTYLDNSVLSKICKNTDKNIPIPSQEDYKIHLISKTENFIKRIRWKALEFLGKLDSTEKETYGFRSRNCPPIVEEVANFENDLMLMIKNVQFKYIKNNFQTKLKEDISNI